MNVSYCSSWLSKFVTLSLIALFSSSLNDQAGYLIIGSDAKTTCEELFNHRVVLGVNGTCAANTMSGAKGIQSLLLMDGVHCFNDNTGLCKAFSGKFEYYFNSFEDKYHGISVERKPKLGFHKDRVPLSYNVDGNLRFVDTSILWATEYVNSNDQNRFNLLDSSSFNWCEDLQSVEVWPYKSALKISSSQNPRLPSSFSAAQTMEINYNVTFNVYFYNGQTCFIESSNKLNRTGNIKRKHFDIHTQMHYHKLLIDFDKNPTIFKMQDQSAGTLKLVKHKHYVWSDADMELEIRDKPQPEVIHIPLTTIKPTTKVPAIIVSNVTAGNITQNVNVTKPIAIIHQTTTTTTKPAASSPTPGQPRQPGSAVPAVPVGSATVAPILISSPQISIQDQQQQQQNLFENANLKVPRLVTWPNAIKSTISKRNGVILMKKAFKNLTNVCIDDVYLDRIGIEYKANGEIPPQYIQCGQIGPQTSDLSYANKTNPIPPFTNEPSTIKDMVEVYQHGIHFANDKSFAIHNHAQNIFSRDPNQEVHYYATTTIPMAANNTIQVISFYARMDWSHYRLTRTNSSKNGLKIDPSTNRTVVDTSRLTRNVKYPKMYMAVYEWKYNIVKNVSRNVNRDGIPLQIPSSFTLRHEPKLLENFNIIDDLTYLHKCNSILVIYGPLYTEYHDINTTTIHEDLLQRKTKLGSIQNLGLRELVRAMFAEPDTNNLWVYHRINFVTSVKYDCGNGSEDILTTAYVPGSHHLFHRFGPGIQRNPDLTLSSQDLSSADYLFQEEYFFQKLDLIDKKGVIKNEPEEPEKYKKEYELFRKREKFPSDLQGNEETMKWTVWVTILLIATIITIIAIALILYLALRFYRKSHEPDRDNLIIIQDPQGKLVEGTITRVSDMEKSVAKKNQTQKKPKQSAFTAPKTVRSQLISEFISDKSGGQAKKKLAPIKKTNSQQNKTKSNSNKPKSKK